MKKLFVAAVAAIALCSIQATAAPLYGTVGITGNIVTPIAGGANSLTFSALPSGDEAVVTTSSGALALAFNTGVNFAPASNILTGAAGQTFTFGAGASSYIFTVSGFSGATLVSNIAGEGSRSVLLLGTYSRGADSSTGSLRLSFQNPQTGNPSTYSGDGSSVPEPGTYALLGSALLGLGLLRRRKA